MSSWRRMRKHAKAELGRPAAANHVSILLRPGGSLKRGDVVNLVAPGGTPEPVICYVHETRSHGQTMIVWCEPPAEPMPPGSLAFVMFRPCEVETPDDE